ARQVQRLFVILTHDERATLTSVNRRSNAVTTTQWQQPSESHRKRVGNETRLLAFVAGERADSRAGTGFAPSVGDFGAEKRAQSRFDESPGAHVLRFFLAPDELRAFWKRLEHFAEPFLSEWIKLLDANEGCVVDFAFTA